MHRDFSIVEKCFVRDKKCERILGGSKTVFIATPDAEHVQLELDLIKTILKEYDVEPYVAVEFRKFGKDIFCEKICGKIIESLFCIVILNDIVGKDGIPIPNPNVYYEYGLMTSLDKKIVPLQKDGQKLAFNIQSLDTIKYTPKSFSREVDAAIKSILIEPEEIEKREAGIIPEKLLIYLGLKGINWPHLQKGSDDEYFVSLGIGLGFFLLIDFTNFGYCCLKVVQGDEDEDNLVLYLKTLLNRILPVRNNVKRQIKEIGDSMTSQDPRLSNWFATPTTEEKRRMIYFKNLTKLIDNTKVFVYREGFRDQRKISDEYRKIEISMKLPELILVDSKEIEAFLSK